MIRRFRLTVVVKGPVFSRSNSGGLFGIDAPVARLPDGTPYLPGTLVLGRIAEALRQIADAQRQDGREDICSRDLAEFFAGGNDGATAGDATFGRGRRRRIFVSDLKAVLRGKDEAVDAVRTRIAIDAATGAVRSGAIQVIETPYATGEEVTFVGEIRLLGVEDVVDNFAKRLRKALAWIGQWGGMRGLGYGEAISASLDAPDPLLAAPSVEADEATVPDRAFLVLRVKDPFCVGERRIDANTYESSDAISGGVIKGAIASQVMAGLPGGAPTLRDAREAADVSVLVLARGIDAIIVRHAVPLQDDGRPFGRHGAIPKCFAVVDVRDKPDQGGKPRLINAAALAEPNAAFLFDERPPRFVSDWKEKHRALASKAFGSTHVSSDLRVRTKIDTERRTSETGKLFAIRYRSVQEHVWVAEVDLGGVEVAVRGDLWNALHAVTRNGIAGIGRGGAFAEASFQRAGARPLLRCDRNGRCAVMLQTAALIRRPDPERREDVTTDYADAFRGLIAGEHIGLELKAIFVEERLAGAQFMAHRLPTGTPYRPFLLTEAGSVFVFEADDAGRACLKGWLEHGLPIPKATLDFYGLASVADLWMICPYLPENGYGEIVPLPEASPCFVVPDDDARVRIVLKERPDIAAAGRA